VVVSGHFGVDSLPNSVLLIVEHPDEPRREVMKHFRDSKDSGSRAVALIATSIGAVAVGAFAIGALAVGRLAVRRIVVGSAKFKSLEIQDLTVTRLHAAEVIVSESLKLPKS
jgi:hypothetical protein